MYEPTNEPREFLGQSRAEAVAKAQEFFGLKEDALLITELRASDVYGLAGRSVVVAVPRERAPRPARRVIFCPFRCCGRRERRSRRITRSSCSSLPRFSAKTPNA